MQQSSVMSGGTHPSCWLGGAALLRLRTCCWRLAPRICRAIHALLVKLLGLQVRLAVQQLLLDCALVTCASVCSRLHVSKSPAGCPVSRILFSVGMQDCHHCCDVGGCSLQGKAGHTHHALNQNWKVAKAKSASCVKPHLWSRNLQDCAKQMLATGHQDFEFNDSHSNHCQGSHYWLL